MAIRLDVSNLMDRMAVKINELVRQDSLKSKWQDGKTGGSYSKQYAKYKANNMRRFTDGKRLKKYKGVSIVSNKTNKVNMTLTGDMANSLKLKTKEVTGAGGSFVMSYKNDKETIGKVIGNQELGRDVVGLNDKNQKIILNMYIDELNKFFRSI